MVVAVGRDGVVSPLSVACLEVSATLISPEPTKRKKYHGVVILFQTSIILF